MPAEYKIFSDDREVWFNQFKLFFKNPTVLYILIQSLLGQSELVETTSAIVELYLLNMKEKAKTCSLFPINFLFIKFTLMTRFGIRHSQHLHANF